MSASPEATALVADLPAGLLDVLDSVPTPYYVFDLARVERRARAFRDGARRVFPDAVLAYPFKVSPLAAVATRALAVYGHAETATEEEMDLARSFGVDGPHTFLGGVGKSEALLARAMGEGVTVKLDSVADVARLQRVWGTAAVHPGFRALLRIALPEGDGLSRFGLTVDDARAAVESGAPWTGALVGVHFHAGTSLQDPAPYARATRWCAPVLAAIAARATDRPPVLDLGGGYPNRPDDQVAHTAERYAAVVAEALATGPTGGAPVAVVLEPGRITVERAGYLIAGVLESSARGDRPAVLVDAGSTLAGGSWSPVRAHRAGVLVPAGAEWGDGPVDVFGNLCHEGDVVAEEALVIADATRATAVAVIGDVGGYRLAAAAPWMQRLPEVRALVDGALVPIRRAMGLADFA